MNKKIILLSILAFALILPISAAAADCTVTPCTNVNQFCDISQDPPKCMPLKPNTLPFMAAKVKATAIGIGIPIVVIGWVVAGILFLTSAGSPEKTGTARKAMIACVIGTLLVVLAMASAGIMDVIKDAFGI